MHKDKDKVEHKMREDVRWVNSAQSNVTALNTYMKQETWFRFIQVVLK